MNATISAPLSAQPSVAARKVHGIVGSFDHREIHAVDAPAFGANHSYVIDVWPKGGELDAPRSFSTTIGFQKGPMQDNGANGVTNEDLLWIVRDRLLGFQQTKHACPENGSAIAAIDQALTALYERTRKRTIAGVEGTDKQH